jgi:hypothetical protein
MLVASLRRLTGILISLTTITCPDTPGGGEPSNPYSDPSQPHRMQLTLNQHVWDCSKVCLFVMDRIGDVDWWGQVGQPRWGQLAPPSGPGKNPSSHVLLVIISWWFYKAVPTQAKTKNTSGTTLFENKILLWRWLYLHFDDMLMVEFSIEWPSTLSRTTAPPWAWSDRIGLGLLVYMCACVVGVVFLRHLYMYLFIFQCKAPAYKYSPTLVESI